MFTQTKDLKFKKYGKGMDPVAAKMLDNWKNGKQIFGDEAHGKYQPTCEGAEADTAGELPLEIPVDHIEASEGACVQGSDANSTAKLPNKNFKYDQTFTEQILHAQNQYKYMKYPWESARGHPWNIVYEDYLKLIKVTFNTVNPSEVIWICTAFDVVYRGWVKVVDLWCNGSLPDQFGIISRRTHLLLGDEVPFLVLSRDG
ncbi:hypothetical protein R1flu_014164 [Riccia fluitans]|uniref:Uncharacterized protein n=1 Tax=Riccia fluitans TaxID=41844 RepID=A0ABD1YFB9_9MARC